MTNATDTGDVKSTRILHRVNQARACTKNRELGEQEIHRRRSSNPNELKRMALFMPATLHICTAVKKWGQECLRRSTSRYPNHTQSCLQKPRDPFRRAGAQSRCFYKGGSIAADAGCVFEVRLNFGLYCGMK